MENSSKETNLLVEQAKMLLNSKVEKLSESNLINEDVKHKIIELEKRIKALEDYTIEIDELYSILPNVIINFRKRTNDIWKDIELIK